MRIWLIKEGEPLPTDTNGRMFRMGLLAKYLAEQQHEVVWWTSTFDHQRKIYRAMETTRITLNENLELIQLHSPISYERNTSPIRLLYHAILGRQFIERSKRMDLPDVIVCAVPTMHFASVAVKFGKDRDVPVILDARDMWPDILERAFPRILRRVAQTVLLPLSAMTNRAFRGATAITGITPAFLEWGLLRARREKTALDGSIHIGCQKLELTEGIRKEELDRWNALGVTNETFNLCYFGSLGASSLELLTVIKAFRILQTSYPSMRLVICGDGDMINVVKDAAKGCTRIVFPGWIGHKEMTSLLEISNVGVNPLQNLRDFRDTLGNKIVQYITYGLPTISSLVGYSKEYLEQYDLGLTYKEGSVEDFRACVERLYLNPEMRRQMSVNATRRYEQDFSPLAVNRQFEECILAVHNSHNNGTHFASRKEVHNHEK